MSIWQKAYETYENHAHLAGVTRVEDRQPLTPVSHIVQRAQIEISLDSAGKFLSATEVPKDKAKTIIPATEKSANRVGDNDCAHPLSDQLRYLCPNGGNKYEAYLSQLTQWSISQFSHPKVLSVLHYIQSGTILNDLARSGLIQKNSDGLEKGKLAGTDYEKCLVRWQVYGLDGSPECWRDQSLFESFRKFYSEISAEMPKQFCMLNGNETLIEELHPRGILPSPNGAKLISANDKTGFTFRGRFKEDWQAATVGYEASQKAHNALQWLVANQGVSLESQFIRPDRSYTKSGSKNKTFPPVYVCWNPKGTPIYPIFDIFSNPSIKNDNKTLPSDFRDDLQRTLQGYKNLLPANEDVVLAIIRASSKGRLSLTYYQEIKSSRFYFSIENWYNTCCMTNASKSISAPTSPLLYWIVCFAFGAQRNGIMQVDDILLAEHLPRLIGCMVEGKKIPTDLVQMLCCKSRHLIDYAEEDNEHKRHNRQLLLHTTCAVLRKHNNDLYGKEKWTMVLDSKCNDKDYLFGRLLAIMEHIERISLEADEQRETNAIRMQSMYCDRPLYTARILNSNLTPYLEKIEHKSGYGVRKHFENMIDEIFVNLPIEEAPTNAQRSLNAPLNDVYILGYFLQRNALRNHKKQEEVK